MINKLTFSIESIYSRQDKTRQDKTRQDKTRQDKTRQDKGLVCPFLSSVNNKAPDKSYG